MVLNCEASQRLLGRKLAVQLYWKLREHSSPAPPTRTQGSPETPVVGASLSSYGLGALPPPGRRRSWGSSKHESFPLARRGLSAPHNRSGNEAKRSSAELRSLVRILLRRLTKTRLLESWMELLTPPAIYSIFKPKPLSLVMFCLTTPTLL